MKSITDKLNGPRHYYNRDGIKRRRIPTFCFECGAQILRPASTTTVPICSECNPELHDRMEAKRKHSLHHNNWYEDGVNDNTTKIYEST